MAAPDLLAELEAGRDRTAARGTARVELRTESRMRMPSLADMLPSRGVLGESLRMAASGAGWLFKTFGPDIEAGRDLRAEGVLDVAGRRWMLDFGSYAQLRVAGQAVARPLRARGVDASLR